MGVAIPKFKGNFKEKIKFYLIIAVIYGVIALIIRLSPSSPKYSTTTKTLTTTKSMK